MNYLEGIDIDTETLKRCIRKGTLSLSFTPVGVVWQGDSAALDADRSLWERYLGV